MKISARINGLLVKRLVIVLAMIFFGWNLYLAIERTSCFFPVGRVFSIESFLTNRIEPTGMSIAVMGSIAREAKKTWKEEGLEIRFLPMEERQVNIKKYPNASPTICVFYQSDSFQGKKIRRYVDFEYNQKFSDLILKEEVLAKDANDLDEDEVFVGKLVPWQGMLREANRFSEADYGKIKEEFPGLVYLFEELRAIRGNGIAMSAIHILAHFKHDGMCRLDEFIGSSRNFKYSRGDGYINQSAVMYAPFFYGKFKRLCWWEDAKHKSGILLPIFVLILLLLHLRLGFVGVLSDELSARRIEMSFRRRAWLCLRYWRQFIFTASHPKLLKIATDICEHHSGCADREQKKKISEDASRVADELRKELGDDDFSKDRYLQNLLEVSQGKGDKNLAYRENCLRLLGKSLERLRKKESVNEIVQVALIAYEKRKKDTTQSQSRERERVSRRKLLLTEIIDLLPKTCSLEFDFWKNSELADLRLTLVLLRSMNNNLVHTFLGRPNFESLIKNKQSPFIVAVKADRREEVAIILKEFGASNRFVEEAEIEYRFPDDLKIDVVFGEGPWGKAPEIKEALLALGAKEVNYYQASKPAQLFSVTKRTSGRRVIVTTCPPHGHGNMVRDSRAPSFNVQIKNAELFASEVAKKVCVLNI